MIKIVHPVQDRFADLDGFRVDHAERGARADIVLDRAPLNRITLRQCEQLRLVFEALDDDPAVRVIVVRSAHEHFCGGRELEHFRHASREQLAKQAWSVASPARCSKPVIAATRGYCFGVGLELALACDFRIATEATLYALAEQRPERPGQVPGSDGAARLQKMVGIGRARDIVMRSRQIPGPLAYDWGIATEFVTDSDLEAATDDMVRELLAYSAASYPAVKQLLNDIDDTCAARLEAGSSADPHADSHAGLHADLHANPRPRHHDAFGARPAYAPHKAISNGS
ncbi:enoyl-CoA hydratase/isomerase family protein [Paraburkholderia acidisoli]|uniref:Enoyl-CoA hydratase/isomerase family protein n=1 Tax=Paraburkholderia acidisoli TaxID=2571748 RepID=A0A7Z2GJQ6_9BURK|nr:enoyl-CoA hydratase/isomerase family protein [Paraburkholderia acidisoli]QGZ63062.1 enoyl-CoA hydratase/isomerase family protein [Paraburkholderia acidisoli]